MAASTYFVGAAVLSPQLPLQGALQEATHDAKSPTFLMVAKNDRTTESVTSLAKILEERNHPYAQKIYPSFLPTSDPANLRGHLIIGAGGVSISGKDVLQFFGRYLGTGRVAHAGEQG
jgi:hypothetical protein